MGYGAGISEVESVNGIPDMCEAGEWCNDTGVDESDDDRVRSRSPKRMTKQPCHDWK